MGILLRPGSGRGAIRSDASETCGDALSSSTLLPLACALLLENHTSPTEDILRSLTAQLQQLTIRIDRLCMAHLREAVEPSDFTRLYRQLSLQRTKLNEQIQSAKTESALLNTEAAAEKLTTQFLAEFPQERELIAQLVERAELTTEKELRIFFRFAEDTSA